MVWESIAGGDGVVVVYLEQMVGDKKLFVVHENVLCVVIAEVVLEGNLQKKIEKTD